MADNPLVRLANIPGRPANSRGYPSIGPLYMKTTTSRDGEPYSGEMLSGARDVFGALSQSSQFKVSLHLAANGSAQGDGNLNDWLQASQLTNDPLKNEYYNFYCAEAELPGTVLNTRDVQGNFQGITEPFASNRGYQPISLTFYVCLLYTSPSPRD